MRRPAVRRRKPGTLRRALVYGASIPERTVRAAAAATGGASRLATDTALPRSFRKTDFYRFFVGNFQRFLIESVGGVKGTYRGSKGRLTKDFLARKTAGDVVEATAILALAYSPLWFFALVSGAAQGSRSFLERVVAELKKDGKLPGNARIRSAEDLLRSLERASLATTVPFDLPPLRLKDVGELRRRIASEYKALARSTRKAVPDVEALWKRLLEVRRKGGLSFLRLTGGMTVAGAKAAGRATGSLFREKVIRSYSASLGKVKRAGFGPFFASAARPYLRAVGRAFRAKTPTLTARLLTGRRRATRRRGSRAASSAPPTVPMS